MSIESATKFLTAAAIDSDLKKHCDGLSSSDIAASAAAITDFAKTRGYDFSASEALAVMNGEMSDSHLGGVSGGLGKVGGGGRTPPVYRPPRRNK